MGESPWLMRATKNETQNLWCSSLHDGDVRLCCDHRFRDNPRGTASLLGRRLGPWNRAVSPAPMYTCAAACLIPVPNVWQKTRCEHGASCRRTRNHRELPANPPYASKI